METHNFEEQLARGQRGEGNLDFLFVMLGYTVKAASAAEQRSGIDRHLTPPGWKRAVTVEYKTDFHHTENAFVETVSVPGKRLGWAFTSQAQYLAYAMPAHSRVWVIPLVRLRERLPDWLQRYPKHDVPNEGYTSQGILVPLREFDDIALRVYLFTQA